MYRILLVEDEKNFGSVLKDYLKMNDFAVELCVNGEEGIETFSTATDGKFDLCIVDIMMPKKDGFTLTSEIKQLDKNIPIIFLTARSMREDMIKGYKLGADDYIVKPFDSEVLLLKIQAILNRNHSIVHKDVFEHTIGHFKFNARLRSLKFADSEIKLSPKESALLNLLCQHKNDVLLREHALKEIWKEDTYFTGRSMDVYLVKLRKHLASDANVELTNLHGNGYSLRVKDLSN